MPILVNLPDGSQASFPEGTPPDVMKAAIQKRFPAKTQSTEPNMKGRGLPSDFSRNQEDLRMQAEGASMAGIPVLGPILSAVSNAGVRKSLRPITDASQAYQNGLADIISVGSKDEIAAGLQTPIQMGIDAFQGKKLDPGRSFNQALSQDQALDARDTALNPAAHLAGQITGGFIGPGKGLGWASKAKSIPGLMVRGGLEGSLLGGSYGFASTNGSLEDRVRGAEIGALTGAGTGAIVPAIAKKGGDIIEGFLQNRATSKAIASAPEATDLFAEGRKIFKSVDNSGVTVDTNRFSQMVHDLVAQAKKDRINVDLDPKSHAAYKDLINALGEVQSSGGVLHISDLHTLRRIAQKASLSKEGSDSMFAGRIVDAIDGLITEPGALKYPPNLLGNGPARGLKDAISTWAQAKRTDLIEKAIEAAKNYPSGLESGLRAQFKTLLNGKTTGHLFTKAERQAMQRVINGTLPITALRTLGMFKGMGGATLGSMLGSMFGPFGTGIGAAAGGAAGIAGRKITEKATEVAAQRAARVVATPNIPIVNLPRLPALPGAPFAFPIIDHLRPNAQAGR